MQKQTGNKTSARQGLLSALPVLVVLIVIRGYPLLIGVIKSFTNWDGMTRSDFVGFTNYINILKDPVFYEMLKNNLIFMIFIVFQLVIGISISILFYEETLGWKFFQSVFYLPQIISFVVTGYLFTVFFSYRGPVNAILKAKVRV